MYTKLIIGYEEARGAVDAMISEVKSKPERYWQYACVVVVDSNGVPICLAKMDGGSYLAYELSVRKARTAALWGMDTSAFHELISKRDWSEQTYGTEYTVCAGGVAIVPPEHAGSSTGAPECLGAIGVSCAGEHDTDDRLARVGLDYIKSVLWPSK